MCNTDFEQAKIWNETCHVARVAHRCYECDRMIPKGERYTRIGCLSSEGRWETYRLHAACDGMWDFITDVVCGGQGSKVVGGLHEEITSHDLDRAELNDDGEEVEGPTPADIYHAFTAHYPKFERRAA